MANYIPTQILNYQDIIFLCNCSKNSAFKYMKDIKTEYNIKYIAYKHYQDYFKL